MSPQTLTAEIAAQQSRLDAEVESLKAKLNLLSEQRESDLESMNDLSEEIRIEMDIINQAIAELSAKIEKKEPRPTKIGYKQQGQR